MAVAAQDMREEIPAIIQASLDETERRSAPRTDVNETVDARDALGDLKVVLQNVSDKGCRISDPGRELEGTVEINVPAEGWVSHAVVWVEEDNVGLARI